MYFIIMNDGRRVERNMFGDPNMVFLSELPEGARAIEIVPEYVSPPTPPAPGDQCFHRVYHPVTVDIILARVSDLTRKISVIKELRQYLGLGLKECKDMVDQAPSLLKEGVPLEDAYEIKKVLEEAGATIQLRNHI